MNFKIVNIYIKSPTILCEVIKYCYTQHLDKGYDFTFYTLVAGFAIWLSWRL